MAWATGRFGSADDRSPAESPCGRQGAPCLFSWGTSPFKAPPPPQPDLTPATANHIGEAGLQPRSLGCAIQSLEAIRPGCRLLCPGAPSPLAPGSLPASLQLPLKCRSPPRVPFTPLFTSRLCLVQKHLSLVNKWVPPLLLYHAQHPGDKGGDNRETDRQAFGRGQLGASPREGDVCGVRAAGGGGAPVGIQASARLLEAATPALGV